MPKQNWGRKTPPKTALIAPLTVIRLRSRCYFVNTGGLGRRAFGSFLFEVHPENDHRNNILLTMLYLLRICLFFLSDKYD